MENAFSSSSCDVNRAFDHGHARTLHRGIHNEHGAGITDTGIRSLDVEMSGLTVRSLDDDSALVEGDRHVLAASRNGEARALVDFDQRSVGELYVGVRAGRGTQHVAFVELIAHRN